MLYRQEGSKTYNIGCRRHPPIFVTPLRESLHDVCLIAHQSQQTHNLFSTGPDSPQHVTLFGLFQDQHQFVDTIDFILNALDKWTESIGNIVDECV